VPLLAELRRSLDQERMVAQATVISERGLGAKMLLWPDGRRSGSLGAAALDDAATEAAARSFATQETRPIALESDDGETVEVFLEVFAPPERLIVVGAVHVAIHLVTFGNTLGMHTVVVDARSAFATPERFPHADELVVRWPAEALRDLPLHEGSYVAFLTHDPKLDNPGLAVALASRARYVGALGSSRTHAKRLAALREMGISEESLARIHAPIGVDLGGRRPDEIALAIAAQVVQARHGRA
jgi:xanthine dehydrogenase accessory factor